MQLPSLLVPLDREFIQRDDFPSTRKGWDPGVVEAHLRAVADEVQLLRRAAEAPTGDPLAAAASAQVRAIVAAAEGGAAELRDESAADARDHVARIAEAAQELLVRIDGYGRELDDIMAGVRAGAARLAAEVAVLDTEAGEPEIRGAPPLTPSAVRLPEAEEPELEADEDGEGPDDDETGARMVALDMALSGTSREDTERYLAEHFGEVADPRQLLDDVYARAGR
jgi:hypothetical protein